MTEKTDTQIPTPAHGESAIMVIPASAGIAKVELHINKTREAERRLIEAKTVNPLTYADLEHCFNESYRELKSHSATVGYHLATAEKKLNQAKSFALLDKYPEFLEKTDRKDSTDLRNAFLMRDEDYLAALDRINMLKAMEAYVEGRIKVLENVCRYMRKQMDLLIRSGLSNADYYITSGKR